MCKGIKKNLRNKKKKIEKYWLLKIKYPVLYKVLSIKPIKNKTACFIENRFDSITNSFSLLHNKIQSEYGYEVLDCFLLETQKKGYKKRCLEMIRKIATAEIVFVNDSSNVVGCIPFRKETKVIQTWHACGAYKKWGYSNAKEKFGANIYELKKYSFYADYDLVTVSSPEIIWAYEEAFNMEGRGIVKATGVSRTDVFYDSKYINNAFNKLHETYPQSKGKRIMLYAPTFRGNVAKAKAPNNLDIKKFCSSLSDDYFLIIKNHPSVKKAIDIPIGLECCVVDASKLLDIDTLMMVSDVCITDYSSVIFEYSLFERPIIIYAYDYDEYVTWRGFYYDFDEFLPGPIVKNTDELIDTIKNLNNYDYNRIQEFKKKYMSSCDGNCTNRILDIVINEKNV